MTWICDLVIWVWMCREKQLGNLFDQSNIQNLYASTKPKNVWMNQCFVKKKIVSIFLINIITNLSTTASGIDQ